MFTPVVNQKTFRLLLFLFCSLVVNIVFGQTLEVTSPLSLFGSVPASTVPTDNNGKPCAKIIVNLPIKDAVITGSYIVGEVTYNAGRYEFFVAIPRKEGVKVTVRHENYQAVDIPLWCDGQPLVGREAYNTKVIGKKEKLTSKDLNNYYVGASFQAISLMGAGVHVGAYFHGVNVELGFLYGFDKSTDINWYESNGTKVGTSSYSPMTAYVNAGYGFYLGKKILLTPYVGAGLLTCNSKWDGSGKDTKATPNSIYMLGGAKVSFLIGKNFSVSVAPQYNFSIKESDSFNYLGKIDSKIADWGNGFNVKADFSILF